MRHKGAVVMIAAGGTYGHINPALSVAQAIKKNPDIEVVFVTTNKELKEKLSGLAIKAYFIDSCKIKTSSLFFFIAGLFTLLKVMSGCFFLLLKVRPRLVIGFGGYAAFPMVFSASLLRLPTAIHEQNVVMGRANRLLSWFVDRIFLSFKPETGLNCARKFWRKTIVTGNPIRRELRRLDKEEALSYLGLDKGLFTILVMGGSTGAHKINEKFTQALSRIDNRHLQVIHISGENDFEWTRDFYAKLGLKARIYSFCEEMPYVFSASDLIISRAGAATISEIAYFKIPVILVPYPYARSHQKENAKTLTKFGKAVMIEDEKLEAENLAFHLTDFLGNSDRLLRMKEQYREEGALDNAQDIITDEALKLIKK